MDEGRQYGYRAGFTARVVTPPVMADEFDRIRGEKGALRSADVLEESRPDDAVLHDEFVWDGEAAITELGLIRARTMIRALVVRLPETPRAPAAPVWVHIPNDNPRRPGEYEKTEVVVENIDLFERALTELQRRYDSAQEALMAVRRAADETGDSERLAAIAMVVQGFGAVREALAILR